MTAQFCKLKHTVMDTEAFRKLSAGATRLFLLLFRRYDGFNNGQIVCSKRDAMQWCHCGSGAAMAYFKELETAGLITQTQKGQFHCFGNRGAYCTTSTWRLNFV
jgi:hypothetical protein